MTTAIQTRTQQRRPISQAASPRALASMIKQRWKAGAPPDAVQAVAEHEVLRHAKSLQLDLAYEEYCLRREAGEAPDIPTFCDRFPSLRASLRRLLDAHRNLEENPEFFAEEAAPVWPEPGTAFLGFRLREELGRGAFARVYLAEEPALGNRLVAVKVAPRGGAEAETLGRLRHPNIVPVYSVQQEAATGLTAVCMPFLGRATLCDVLDQLAAAPRAATQASSILAAIASAAAADDPAERTASPHPLLRSGAYVEGIVHLAAQLTDALAFAHGLGIYHRDLKPSNVLLTAGGEPLLLDFNLAYDAEQPLQRLGGTLPYMAPELLLATDPMGTGDGTKVGAPADVFALGVLVHELLTGMHPFGPLPGSYTQASLRALLLEKQRRGPRSLRLLQPALDPVLIRLLERCLAFEPAERPSSAAEVGVSLRRVLTPWRRARRWLLQRSPVLLIGGGLVLAAASGGGLMASSAGTDSAVEAPVQDQSALAAGQRAYQRGDYVKAAEHFSRAINFEQGGARALFARGRAHQQLAEKTGLGFDTAYHDYVASDLKAASLKTKACIAYAQCRMRNGLVDASIPYLQTCIDEGMATPENRSNLAAIQLQGGAKERLASAKANLDAALLANPNLYAARHNRALLAVHLATSLATGLSKEERRAVQLPVLEAGVEDIQQAIKLGPPSGELFVHAARLHCQLGRFDPKSREQALHYLTLAVEHGFDPHSPNASEFSDLADMPSYHALCKKAPDAVFSKAQRLVDPLNGSLD
jgi:serine/threonine protein kinase